MAAQVAVLLNLHPRSPLSGAALDNLMRDCTANTFQQVRSRYGQFILGQHGDIGLEDQTVIITWSISDESMVQEIGEYTKQMWRWITANV